MPYFLSQDIVSVEDIQSLPITVEAGSEIASDTTPSSFYYFKGGGGGDLGKKSTFPSYSQSNIRLFSEQNQDNEYDVDSLSSTVKGSYLSSINQGYINSNTSEKFGLYNSDNKQTDAGYAIKYVTGLSRPTIGGGTVVDEFTSTVTFDYEPIIPADITRSNPSSSVSVASDLGVNAQYTKRFTATPSAGFAFHCEFDYDHATNLITIDQIQRNGQLYDLTPEYNFTGMKLYLSGSGNAQSFSRSLRIHDINGSSLYGYADYATGSSVLSNYSGVIYLCGNGGEIYDSKIIMSDANVGFIASDSYTGQNQDYFYYQLPSSGFIKMPIETNWDNMLVVYAVELDYDDKDRKLDPALIAAGQIYDTGKYFDPYIGMSGIMDTNWEFYWNNYSYSWPVDEAINKNLFAPVELNTFGVNRCVFPFSLMSRTEYTTASQMEDLLSGQSLNAFQVEIDRWYTGFNRYPNQPSVQQSTLSTRTVREPRNTISFNRDTFGLFDENLGPQQKPFFENWNTFHGQSSIISRDELFFSTTMAGTVYERGSFVNSYEWEPYDSFDRKKVQNKSKFNFIYHAYNKKSNTYFWGINDVRNTRSQFVMEDYIPDIKNANYIYISNWCKENYFPDYTNSLFPSTSVYKQKRQGGSEFQAAVAKDGYVFDAVKMNIYDIFAYVNVGDGSDAAINQLIDIVYDNFKQRYKNKFIFGGAVTPSQYEGTAQISMNTYHSEISESGVYYDGFLGSNPPFYGKMQFVTDYL